MKIISIHLPKTAGSSFRSSLETAFSHRLIKDYKGSGIALKTSDRNHKTLLDSISAAKSGTDSFDCIHGHFPPARYLLLRDKEPLTFVTWMRDPLARMISHYNYWQQTYNPDTSAPHHQQAIEEKWSLEEFCLNERFRNIYTQYLWAFPLEYFDFIGITEHYEEDFRYFSKKYLKQELAAKHENSSKKVATVDLSKQMLRKIKAFHAEDFELYQRALDIRQKHRK